MVNDRFGALDSEIAATIDVQAPAARRRSRARTFGLAVLIVAAAVLVLAVAVHGHQPQHGWQIGGLSLVLFLIGAAFVDRSHPKR